MTTFGAFLVFLGFFSTYNSSRKAVLTGHLKLEIWLRNNVSNARIAGLVLLVAALIVLVIDKGVGAGSLMFFVTLMLVGSLVVLLSPLKILTIRTASVIFAICLFVELLNIA